MKSFKIQKNITNRDDEALNLYLKDIAHYKLLSLEEEKDLIKKAKSGDKLSYDKLIRSNLRFVVSVAKQYQNQGLDLIDLISEGNIGICQALDRFDETKGVKFISYAVWWIRQAILDALYNKGREIRLPANKISAVHKINKTINDFEQLNERQASPEELEELLNTDYDSIQDILSSITKTVSVDTPINSEEECFLIDVIPNNSIESSDNILLEESLNKNIELILNLLSYRDSDVLKMFFGLYGIQPLPLVEIGKKFGLTSERVRQIKDKALLTLKTKHLDKIKVLFD